MDEIELLPERGGEDPREPGPLSVSGERVFGELERAVAAGDAPIGPQDLQLLASATQTLADYGRLLVGAAAGELATLDLLRDRLQGEPGAQLWRDLEIFSARMPAGPILDSPCQIGPANLPAMLWTGFQLSGGVFDPVWVDRAFREYAALGGGIDAALGGAGRWLASGDPRGPREGFEVLRGVGLPGQPRFSFPCVDEQQVCLSEFLFFSQERLSGPTSFPEIASVSPPDACLGYAGPITLLPAAGAFPLPAGLKGAFPTIDRQPADIISWTAANIQLRLPAGIGAGCHTVGWMYLLDADAVTQLRGIGEQCMPWFPQNSLRTFPYSLWRDDAQFSLIGEPAVSVDANGAAVVQAEGCTPVTLRWAVTLASCQATLAALAVSMLRNGQPFRPTLPATGQLPVTDADDATYTLQARSRLGAQTCATVERGVTVNRHKRIRIRPPVDRCLDTQASVSLDINISCPAPAGGLDVTVASNQRARVADAAATIPEGAQSISIDVTAGSQCGPVTLTVTAADHSPVQVSLVVVAIPQIAAITPTALTTCDNIAFTLTGSCLGDPSLPPSVVLSGPSGDEPATVTVRSPQQEIAVSRAPLAAGLYTVAVSNCGRVGYPPTPLTVQTRPPQIRSELAASAAVVLICATPTLTLSWEVEFVSSVRLLRGATLVAERSYDPCQRVSDSVADTLPTVTGAVSYTLIATNPDGATVTSALTIPAAPPAPPASSFAAVNNYTGKVNVFLLNAEDVGGSFVATLDPGQGVSVAIPTCRIRAIASLDPALVAKHNSDYPRSQFSATVVATVRTSGIWSRNSSAFVLGRPASGVVGVSV